VDGEGPEAGGRDRPRKRDLVVLGAVEIFAPRIASGIGIGRPDAGFVGGGAIAGVAPVA
jgi:hypothetical protein